MADGTAEVARAFAQLTTALIEMMTRLSVALIERTAERLRDAARQNEQRARQERARLARHHAADAAIWQRTADPAWWARATPEQIARVWRAVSTWHQVDPEAAGARHAMAERLRAIGVDVAQDVSANPADARWLQTALDLARAEAEERIAFRDDLDTDAELANELMWDPDELPRDQAGKTEPAEAHADTETADNKATTPTVQEAKPTTQQVLLIETTSEILWDADEQPRPPRQTSSVTGSPASGVTGEVASGPNGVRLDLAAFDAAQAKSSSASTFESTGETTVDMTTQAQGGDRLRQAVAKQTAVATQPNDPRRLPEQEMTRMAGMLRSAWQAEPDRVQRVLSDGAWPALASSMHRLDAQGKDVQGLLSRLDAASTESSIPAVTTDWALRAAAAGPVAAQRMKTARQAHQARLATARQQQPVVHVAPQARDDNVQRRSAKQDSSTEAARLLAEAFPYSTRTALNRQRPVPATVSGRPDVGRDRAARRDRETAPAER